MLLILQSNSTKLENDKIPILDQGQRVSIATIDKTTIDSITNAATIGDNETPTHHQLNQQLHGRILNGLQGRLTIKSRKKPKIFHILLASTAMEKDIMPTNVQNRNR